MLKMKDDRRGKELSRGESFHKLASGHVPHQDTDLARMVLKRGQGGRGDNLKG